MVIARKLETKKAYGTNWKLISIVIQKLNLAMEFVLIAIENKLKNLKKMVETYPDFTEPVGSVDQGNCGPIKIVLIYQSQLLLPIL